MFLKPPDYKYISFHRKLETAAQKLRKNQTKSEELLWKRLRGKQLGYKFRRQYPLYRYIADFYCSAAKLVIEIDGPIHDKHKEYDIFRNDYMKLHGYTVLRFTNEIVEANINEVILKIKQSLPCKGRLGGV